MSKFFSKKYKNLIPYTPGEQPKDNDYIKLNTNESPFPPSEIAVKYATEELKKLNLYPDPECKELNEMLSKKLNVEPDEILATNGSDEILNFAFMAFCDDEHTAVFPNITYGFYTVFAEINNIPYEEIPLKSDFTININDYTGINKNIFIANPNAPTGIALSIPQIEEIVKSNPDNVVVIDEAYIDFGNKSAVSLIHKYDNLLVTQTFSKSRSMAGARLGFGVGCKELIRDLNTVKYSTNPYNINRATMAMGIGTLKDDEYIQKNCAEIIRVREFTVNELKNLGFKVTNSSTNFIFAKHAKISGESFYKELKSRGILVRHFSKPEICDYNRITIGSIEQMKEFIKTTKEILEAR